MTRYPHTALCFALLMLAVVYSLAGCAPPIYFARATHGTVVDADTQQPIAGAVVVGDWIYDDWIRHGNARFEAAEAVTDADGAYVLPGWGPRVRPSEAVLAFFPLLLVYKHGYELKKFDNESVWNDPSAAYRMVHSSDWDGKALAIRKFRGTPKERKSQLEDQVVHECHFEPIRSMPHLYNELLSERTFLGSESEDLVIRAEPCRRGW